MTFEWDLQNAGANLRKHRVTFEEPASVFLNPSATTFPDPDHSSDECREIAIGSTMKGRLVFVSHCERPGGPGSSARVSLLAPVVNNMKKDKASKHPDDLRPEYDLSLLKGAVRGKYHNRAASPTNLVLIDADLANLFPDAEA